MAVNRSSSTVSTFSAVSTFSTFSAVSTVSAVSAVSAVSDTSVVRLFSVLCAVSIKSNTNSDVIAYSTAVKSQQLRIICTATTS